MADGMHTPTNGAAARSLSPASPTSPTSGCSSPSVWQPDSAFANCMLCGANFGVVTRRHHCRQCGNVFCGKCTKGSLHLPSALTTSKADRPQQAPAACKAKEQRACNICLPLVTPPRPTTTPHLPTHPLPPALMLHVALFLPPSAVVASLTRLSVAFYNLCSHPLLWRRTAALYFPNLGIHVANTVAEATAAVDADEAADAADADADADASGVSFASPPPSDAALCAREGEREGWSFEAGTQKRLHASLLQRQSPPGYYTFELPHYLRALPVSTRVKRDWSTPLPARLAVGEPGPTGNRTILCISIPVCSVHNWKYFVQQKMLEVAHRDLEFPLNTTIFARRDIVAQMLKSFDARLARRSGPAGCAGGGGGGASGGSSNSSSGGMRPSHSDPQAPPTPEPRPTDRECLSRAPTSSLNE